MRVGHFLLPLLLAASGSAQSAEFISRRDLNGTLKIGENATPRRFIVELKSRAHRAHVSAKVTGLPGLRVVKEFDSDLFPGVSIECESHCSAESLTDALDADEDGPVVASVYRSTLVRLLPPAIEGESFSNDAAAANYSVHGSTGVEKLHQAGIIGEGAIIAVVDSGVQYTHPAVKSSVRNLPTQLNRRISVFANKDAFIARWRHWPQLYSNWRLRSCRQRFVSTPNLLLCSRACEADFHLFHEHGLMYQPSPTTIRWTNMATAPMSQE